MSDEDFVPVSTWLTALLSPSQAELARRGLRLHEELDEHFVIENVPGLETAFAALMEFVLRSVPDGCEIYLAAGRQVAPVSRLGAGQLTLRWQIADRDDCLPNAGQGRVVALRSKSVDGSSPAQAASSSRIRAGFDAAGWDFSLEALGGSGASGAGEELVVRVSRR